MGGDVFDARLEGFASGGFLERRHNCVSRASMTAACVRDEQQRPFGHIQPQLGSNGNPPRPPALPVANPAAGRRQKRQERSGWSVVEAEDVAELDGGIFMMAIVVFREHYS